MESALQLPGVSLFWFLFISLSFVGYLAVLGIYRLYFHPLSHFPGPKLAALTPWYEFYYDVILDGSLHSQLQKLHEIYGPIIRFRPDELHIRDSDFYDTLYSRSAKRDKSTVQTQRLGFTKDTFSTAPHDLHRSRRKAVAPFFSLQKVDEYQSVIREEAETLCNVISKYQDGQVLSIDRMWTALTSDVISRYSFAESMRHIESPGFVESFVESTDLLVQLMTIGVHFPSLLPILESIPVSIVKRLQPDMQVALRFKDSLVQQIANIRLGRSESHKHVSHQTIFQELLESPLLPESEKTDDRLADEALVVISAGLATTAAALTNTTFYLIEHPEMQKRLQQELRDAGVYLPSGKLDPEKLNRKSLEALPYLFAVVREGIRMSGGGTGVRLTRLAPEQEIIYKEWVIPRNTAVGMSNMDILFDEDIFPDANEFTPDRWLGEEGKEVERRGWVAFGRGSRMCLGMNLAYAEIYIGLVTVFSRFHLELYETDKHDVIPVRCTQVSYPKRSSKGVRVLVSAAKW